MQMKDGGPLSCGGGGGGKKEAMKHDWMPVIKIQRDGVQILGRFSVRSAAYPTRAVAGYRNGGKKNLL